MKPLDGIKVIEFAQFVAGPVAGRILAEWGADVIKVESPGGDHNRSQGLLNNMPIADDDNPAFDSTCFNKRFVSVDTRSAVGLEIVHQLLKEANVFITNYRPAVLKKMGLDYETLHAKYPKLIYGHATGYGLEGPDKDSPGYDTVCFYARGGISGTWYQKGSEPVNTIPAFGDMTVGMMLAGGIAGAIAGQALHGTGDKVTASLYHAALWGNSWPVMATEFYETSQYPKSRADTTNPGLITYPAADKWVQLACPVWETYYDRVVECLGRKDLINDLRYKYLETIQKNGKIPELVTILGEAFKKRTAAEWLSIFRAADVPLEICGTYEDIVSDEQAWANDFLFKAKTDSGAEHIYVAPPIQLDSAKNPERIPTKRVGYHTKEVLEEYGYSPADIDQLSASGIIVT